MSDVFKIWGLPAAMIVVFAIIWWADGPQRIIMTDAATKWSQSNCTFTFDWC